MPRSQRVSVARSRKSEASKRQSRSMRQSGIRKVCITPLRWHLMHRPVHKLARSFFDNFLLNVRSRFVSLNFRFFLPGFEVSIISVPRKFSLFVFWLFYLTTAAAPVLMIGMERLYCFLCDARRTSGTPEPNRVSHYYLLFFLSPPREVTIRNLNVPKRSPKKNLNFSADKIQCLLLCL